VSKKGDLVYSGFYAPHLQAMQSNPAVSQQHMTERMYMRVLSELCMNRFKWEGLPESVDPRFVEMNLFYRGLVVFYFDNDFDEYMALRASGAGGLNFNDNPISFVVTGNGNGAKYINKTLTAVNTVKDDVQLEPECVPIWSNYLRMPDLDIVSLYAKKLAAIDRTIEINIEGMRYTKLVTTDENSRQSWVNVMRQHTEGQPVLFTTQSLNPESNVSVFDVGVPSEAVPNLQIARAKLWGECMGLLGINNANQDKKERLVAAEVGANDEQVDATKAINMNARTQACEQINKLYGLNISVEFNGDNEAVADAELQTESVDE